MRLRFTSFALALNALLVLLLCAPLAARAQNNNLLVYDDALQGWDNYSWCATDLNSTAYTHSGSHSVKVTYTGAWQGFYLHNAGFTGSLYTALNFWINGGAANGRNISVSAFDNSNAQSGVPLNNYLPGGVQANTWKLVSIPLADLHVANSTSVTGFWLQDNSGGSQPAYYVDDITFLGANTPVNVNVSVNAASVVRTVDSRMFGANAAIWDDKFNTSQTTSLLSDAGTGILRFPGGSASDGYHWQTNSGAGNSGTWANSFDSFANVARAVNSQVFITTNYGSGTAQEAADWVTYSNKTKGYGFKYW